MNPKITVVHKTFDLIIWWALVLIDSAVSSVWA